MMDGWYDDFEPLTEDGYLRIDPEKNVVQQLNELRPGLIYECEAETERTQTQAPTFTLKVLFNGMTFKGTSYSKKKAKAICAERALKGYIKQYNHHVRQGLPLDNMLDNDYNPKLELFTQVKNEDKGKNPIQVMNEVRPGTEFEVESETGEAHSKTFVMSVNLDNEKFKGTAPNKKMAKSKAAQTALETVFGFQFTAATSEEEETAEFLGSQQDINNVKDRRKECTVFQDDPVEELISLYPDVAFYVSIVGDGVSTSYLCQVEVEGHLHEFSADTRKMAKCYVASAALEQLRSSGMYDVKLAELELKRAREKIVQDWEKPKEKPTPLISKSKLKAEMKMARKFGAPLSGMAMAMGMGMGMHPGPYDRPGGPMGRFGGGEMGFGGEMGGYGGEMDPYGEEEIDIYGGESEGYGGEMGGYGGEMRRFGGGDRFGGGGDRFGDGGAMDRYGVRDLRGAGLDLREMYGNGGRMDVDDDVPAGRGAGRYGGGGGAASMTMGERMNIGRGMGAGMGGSMGVMARGGRGNKRMLDSSGFDYGDDEPPHFDKRRDDFGGGRGMRGGSPGRGGGSRGGFGGGFRGEGRSMLPDVMFPDMGHMGNGSGYGRRGRGRARAGMQSF